MQEHPLVYPIENLPKLFISWATIGVPQCLAKSKNCIFRPDEVKTEKMNQYMNEVEEATGIHAMKFWYFLNKPYVTEALMYSFFKGYHDFSDIQPDLYDSDQIDSVLSALQQPKVHGDYNKEMVFIPFCAFGSKVLKNCTEFKEVDSTFFAQDKKCYTFNFDGKRYGRSITPNSGLTFIGMLF